MEIIKSFMYSTFDFWHIGFYFNNRPQQSFKIMGAWAMIAKILELYLSKIKSIVKI